MSKFRTLSVLDSEIEAIASFLQDRLYVLPSLPLDSRERFPRVQCVYFVVSEQVIYYIGCTKNLYLRWLEHHRDEASLALNDSVVYWFACPGLSVNDAFRLEQSLLREVPTQFNQMRPRPDRPMWQRTEIYTSHQIKYVRYRWGKGRENWGYLHIPGGDAQSELVKQRRSLVDAAIASGLSVEEIKKMMLPWAAAAVGRKRNREP
jgi:predicted GIY-YIG superfamily endonuclease